MRRGVGTATHVHSKWVALASNLRVLIFYRLKVARDLAALPRSAKYTFRQPFLSGYGDTRWHQLYSSLSGISSDYYVPEDLFFVNIERKFNPLERAWPYGDKNCYDRLGLPCIFPRTLGRIMVGRFLDTDYGQADPETLASEPTVVVKPSIDTGGGKNVRFLTGSEAATFARRSLRNNPSFEWIFQEPIRQSARLGAIAPASVNTLRIMTMLLNGRSYLLSTVLRMGRNGSRVDNQSGGGLACGVRGGVAATPGYDINMRSWDRHPDTNIPFKDLVVPGWSAATKVCIAAQSVLPEVGLISWDVAIDEDERPVVIELNSQDQGIDFHQYTNGPLFGELLPEVLMHTKPHLFFGVPLH